MDNIIKQIKYFTELFDNLGSNNTTEKKEVEKRLLEVINKLNSDELTIFSKYYQNPKYVDLIDKFQQGTLKKVNKGGINVLRDNLLKKYLLKNEKITSEIIDFEKQEIRNIVNKYDKNYDPFRAWKNSRVLYHFCYHIYNDKISKFLETFTVNLRKELNIISITKQNTVTFDGAQNQGYDHCWIAIYDKKFQSQKETKQLYVGFHKDKVIFDIYEHATGMFGTDLKKSRGEIPYENFDIRKIVEFFKDKKEDIFELRHSEKELDKSIKKFKKNKQFTKKEREQIENKIYSEESIFNSQSQVINRKNHHYKIYNLIRPYLKKNYDKHHFEKNNIDITAIKDDNLYLFEIKPFDNPIYTVRFALGQLIEYYYNGHKKAKYLCFIGIKSLGENKIYFNYIKNLFKNESFKLKYFYVDYGNSELIEDK